MVHCVVSVNLTTVSRSCFYQTDRLVGSGDKLPLFRARDKFYTTTLGKYS